MYDLVGCTIDFNHFHAWCLHGSIHPAALVEVSISWLLLCCNMMKHMAVFLTPVGGKMRLVSWMDYLLFMILTATWLEGAKGYQPEKLHPQDVPFSAHGQGKEASFSGWLFFIEWFVKTEIPACENWNTSIGNRFGKNVTTILSGLVIVV